MVTTGTKRLFFISGDVGGARALLPVILECEKRDMPFYVAANGHMAEEAPARWSLIDPPLGQKTDGIAKFLTDLGVGVLIFGSSVHDILPLTVARQAKRQGIPVVHILDNWTGYRLRLENDHLPMLLPDVYTLMDEIAREDAIAEGIDPAVLVVTGHPGLASHSREMFASEPRNRRSDPARHLLFVSEPAAADQGDNPSSPTYRGYTETEVLRLLCTALQPFASEVVLEILPHPRENAGYLTEQFDRIKGGLRGSVIANGQGQTCLLDSDGVVGMASLLLYNAWLSGKPVLSLQPNLRRNDLRMLARREGVRFLDVSGDTNTVVAEWLTTVRNHRNGSPHPDLIRHRQAAKRIASILQERLSADESAGTQTIGKTR